MIRRDYLIIGAGASGASVCEGIRQYDPKGTVMLVGAEAILPYRRPALLKAHFGKQVPLEKLLHLPEAWFSKQKIDLRLDALVTQVNLERRLAVLATGQAIEFKKACLATGSRPRRPQVAGGNVGNVFYPRALRDVQALREMVDLERSIIVLGGGLVAAESAALLSLIPKKEVTILHRGKGLWNRILDEETSAWLTLQFADRGIKMLLGEQLNGFEGRTVLKNVQTKSGQRIAAGIAVVAYGCEPNLGLVLNTPLSYPHGTPVNDYLETEEKGIFAVGDIASYPDKVFGGVRRVDHWDAAIQQGLVAGANITGKKRIKFEYMPAFSCDVFDLHFDFAGDFSQPPTRVELDGDRAKKKFLARYFHLDRLMGAVLCNQSPEKLQAVKIELRETPRGKKKAD